ncbi:MAG: aminopeptidase P family protein [Rhodospirillales bacterium]|jgi:Xaa-Pro dipeptidase|nr:aminopeptidase P family protein [Rhodospirillales bacterium]
MTETEYWFSSEEYAARLVRVQEEIKARGAKALLAFQPETVTWVTGFFTRGYSSFQFAVIPAEGDPVIVCRDVEEYYLDRTCIFAGRYLWSDSDNKVELTARAVRETVGDGGVLAIEMGSWQLNAARYAALIEGFPNTKFIDAGAMVTTMRFIKLPAEIAYQRRAAKAAEAGMEAGRAAAGPGVTEREMAAEICAAMIRAGSDLPGPGVLSSGERAFHLHGGYGDRVLEDGDVVQLECTPNVRHHHARFMRPIKIGAPTAEELDFVGKMIDIQDRAIAEVGPGVHNQVPDRIYREGALSAELVKRYTNKSFYSVGFLLQPSGGEPLEAAPGAEWSFMPGMTFHTYILAANFGMSETITITETGCERLTNFRRELLVAG